MQYAAFSQATPESDAGGAYRFHDLLDSPINQLGGLLDLVSDGLLIVNLDGYIVDINKIGHKRLGYTKAEMIGMHIAALGSIEFAQKVQECLAEQVSRSHVIFESAHRRKDGSVMNVEVNSRLIDIDNGQYLLSVCRDITERKKAEAALLAKESQYRVAIETSVDGFWMVDAQGRLLEVNAAYELKSGYGRDELLDMSIADIETQETPEEIAAHIEAIKRNGHAKFESEHRKKDGSTWPVQIVTTFSALAGGRLFVFITDLTERKLAEQALAESKLRWKFALEGAGDGVWDWNIQTETAFFSKRYKEMLGYSDDEIGNAADEWFKRVHPEDRPRVMADLQAHIEGKTSAAVIEHRLLCKDGSWKWILGRGKVVSKDAEGKPARFVGTNTDISERKQHQEQLERIAHYDVLTNLPNRILLADRMKQSIAQTKREQNMMGLCYLDLDGFKSINDTMGHESGDQVLVEMSRRIMNTIRGGDTVARLGGDEFVVLLLGLEKGEECTASIERLLYAISRPIWIKGKLVEVGASIGVSIYPLDDEDPDTLLRHADQSMYMAKQAGKNRFHVYDPALDQRARTRHAFMADLQHALEKNEFVLHYQPKVDLRSRQLVGAEALIRWQHPEKGLLPPAAFLHAIGNTDLDIEIGEWVIGTALAQMRQWRFAGLDIEVSINISAFHLESADFVERLRQKIAQQEDLPANKLQIEVLETAALEDVSSVSSIIEMCREFGVGFALDDFGTGYSSLTYLSRLPVDTLKIDQSFVRGMLEDKGDKAIVQGIIALATAFERQTVAEGIETEAHYDVLLKMGCELGQGYVIACPMPADQLTKWHATQNET